MRVLEEIQSGPAGGLEMSVQHEAHRTGLAVVAARGEARIIGERGISAHGDGREEAAQAMHIGLRGRTGDRPALPGRQGQLAVERRRDLERDERRAARDPVIEDQVQLGAFLAEHAFDDRDALGAQEFEAMAGMGRIRIAGAHDHGAETRGQDGVHARRSAPVRAARLERDVQDGVRGGLTAQGAQGHDLGMRLAGLGVEAFGDDLTAFGDDRPHHRVRVRAPPSLTGELEGSPHRRLGSGHGHDQRLRLRETAAALALPGVSCGSE